MIDGQCQAQMHAKVSNDKLIEGSISEGVNILVSSK